MDSSPHTDEIRWYAARISNGEALITKRLAGDGITSYRTKYASGIVFLRCTRAYAYELVSLFYGKVFFYLDTERKTPAPISDREMDNFILVTSASDELIALGEVTPDFLQGDKVRVKDGLLKGAEGVVKRIKGSRRLIVSINGCTAVATCFIKPELLEKVT